MMSGKKVKILPGKSFGAVTVVRESGSKYRTMKKWIVRCSVCGNEKEMRSSSILRNPKSCGCAMVQPHRLAEASKAAVSVNVKDGVQLYVATKETPNKGNGTGFRWVRVLHRKNRDWFFANFRLQGKTYYKGGFSSAESAHEWAQEEHRRALLELGIEDPRKKKKDN